MENELFKRVKFDNKKLLEYGFVKENDKFTFTTHILDKFKVIIIIKDNEVSSSMYDLNTLEEYVSYKQSDNVGSFVSKVREAYYLILKDIKSKCSNSELFIMDQTNRIAAKIKEIYNNDPEFLWESSPGAGVFRNTISKKWYGIVMNIDKSKIDSKCKGEIEVINLKLDKNKIEKLVLNEGYYKAYHMNKKYWISIILDDTLSDEVILEHIEESYNNSK